MMVAGKPEHSDRAAMAIEETDYECSRCLSRYVLTLSMEERSSHDAGAHDFMCPKCGRRFSDLVGTILPGALMAYRRH